MIEDRDSYPSAIGAILMRRVSRERSSADGFTLIELLVVIAIIGVLVALIMPAVQAARESANRAKCLNNMKQLGLAAQEYHDSFNSLPAGWYCSVPIADPNNPGAFIGGDTNCATPATAYQTYMWNGLTGFFTKLELTNLWNEININLPPTDRSNWTSIRREVATLVCPSNPKAEVNPLGVTGAPRPGASSYRANMAAGMVPPGSPGCVTQNPSVIDCCLFDNGVMYQNSSINFADITDGTTTTILMGETLQGNWADGTSCCVRTNIDRTINKPIGGRFNTYWQSKHPGLVNFLRCDGSVSTTKESINKLVLIKLMTRAGGEALSDNETR